MEDIKDEEVCELVEVEPQGQIHREAASALLEEVAENNRTQHYC